MNNTNTQIKLRLHSDIKEESSVGEINNCSPLSIVRPSEGGGPSIGFWPETVIIFPFASLAFPLRSPPSLCRLAEIARQNDSKLR